MRVTRSRLTRPRYTLPPRLPPKRHSFRRLRRVLQVDTPSFLYTGSRHVWKTRSGRSDRTGRLKRWSNMGSGRGPSRDETRLVDVRVAAGRAAHTARRTSVRAASRQTRSMAMPFGEYSLRALGQMLSLDFCRTCVRRPGSLAALQKRCSARTYPMTSPAKTLTGSTGGSPSSSTLLRILLVRAFPRSRTLSGSISLGSSQAVSHTYRHE